MTSYVNDRAYQNAVRISLPNLGNGTSIGEYASAKPLQFSYGDAKYEVYGEKYSNQNEFGRKVIAIPAAICTGLLPIIIDIAKIVFHGIPKAIAGQSSHLKGHVFTLIRHLEKSLGWIMAIFHDKVGTFLISEADFHLDIYKNYPHLIVVPLPQPPQIFPMPPHVGMPSGTATFHSSSFAFVNGREIRHVGEASRLTLLDFRAMNEAARHQTILKFDLVENLKAFGGPEKFFKKLEETDEEFLKSCNFCDMQMDPNTSKIKYAILSDAKFMKLTVGQVINAPKAQIAMIAARLAKLPSQELNQEVTAANVMDLPLVKLSHLPGSAINQFIEQIPGRILI